MGRRRRESCVFVLDGVSDDQLDSALLAGRALQWGQYRVLVLETDDSNFMTLTK